MNYHCWNFRNWKNSVSSFWHFLSNFGEGSSLTCTWSTSDNNFIDWELSVVSNFVSVELFFQVNLIHLRDEVNSLRRLLTLQFFFGQKDLSDFFLLNSFMNQVSNYRNESCSTQNLSLIIWHLINDVTHAIPNIRCYKISSLLFYYFHLNVWNFINSKQIETYFCP